MPPRRKADTPDFSTGVLNVDKDAGETSFAVVNRLRRLTRAGRPEPADPSSPRPVQDPDGTTGGTPPGVRTSMPACAGRPTASSRS